MNNTLITIGLALGFIIIILSCELIYRQFPINAEYTRKFAHCISTMLSLSFMFFYESYWNVLLIGCLFFLILFIGKRNNFFQSIESVKRKTAGSFLLPLAICITFVISKEQNSSLLFVLPILILGISDPLAGISGIVYKDTSRRISLYGFDLGKTIIGSSTFFISTFIIATMVLHFYNVSLYQILFLSILISSIATIVELISPRGLDNLTVPLFVSLILIWVM